MKVASLASIALVALLAACSSSNEDGSDSTNSAEVVGAPTHCESSGSGLGNDRLGIVPYDFPNGAHGTKIFYVANTTQFVTDLGTTYSVVTTRNVKIRGTVEDARLIVQNDAQIQAVLGLDVPLASAGLTCGTGAAPVPQDATPIPNAPSCHNTSDGLGNDSFWINAVRYPDGNSGVKIAYTMYANPVTTPLGTSYEFERNEELRLRDENALGARDLLSSDPGVLKTFVDPPTLAQIGLSCIAP